MRRSPAASFIAALGFADKLWKAQGNEAAELALMLVLPRPRQHRGRRVVVEARRPALVLDSGSVRATVTTSEVRPRRFGVFVFPLGRSRRHGNLVEPLRSRATLPNTPELPRLEGVRQAELDEI